MLDEPVDSRVLPFVLVPERVGTVTDGRHPLLPYVRHCFLEEVSEQGRCLAFDPKELLVP